MMSEAEETTQPRSRLARSIDKAFSEPTLDKDPFDAAAESASVESAELGQASTAETDVTEPEAPTGNPVKENVIPEGVERRSIPLRFDGEAKVKRVGGKRASFAMLLSLISVGGVGYVAYEQFMQSQNLSQEAEDVTTIVGSLSEDLNNNTLNLVKLQGRADALEKDVERITPLEKEMANQGEMIKAIDTASKNQFATNAELIESLKQSQQRIVDLNEQYQNLSASQQQVAKLARQKAAAQPVTTATRSAPPAPVYSTHIGSAVIESMDSWGHNQYVVLKEPSGEWVSLRRGSAYEGWMFSGATDEYALFKRGDRTMKVRVGVKQWKRL